MSTPDSFDRQFRRTARGMRRRPSPRTWDRIENRLDRRTPSARFLGIRPWMIAAVVLIVAGFAVLSQINQRPAFDPLAQRAESVEELTRSSETMNRIPDYSPIKEGRVGGELRSRSEPRGRLTPSPKYRL
ncbi:MAG: anti-sigma factor [Lewinella sp.]